MSVPLERRVGPPLRTLRRGAAAVLLALPVPLHAQQPANRNCLIQIDSAGTTQILQPPGGREQVFAGRGVWGRCVNDPTTMRSDSLAWFAEAGELRLLGQVHFTDSMAVLDADRVTYWVRQERLYAEGRVYTRNLASGSELRGPNLDYYRARPGIRDTLEIRATGRPRITFVPQRSDTVAASADTAEPFIIVADRVRMRGTQRMWGWGSVTIDRSDLAARSDSAMLDLADTVGYLYGSPRVSGRDSASRDTAAAYTLVGQRIRFDLDSRQDIRRVLSSGAADALGPDWKLAGDTIDLTLDSNRIQRARAWGRTRRASATSDLSTITADSLDIRMPAQVMELVWAYGGGRAVSKSDSTQPEDDWLSGDTLRASFRAYTDSLQRRRSEIERVAAFGTARAYYHVDNDRDRNGPRGVNYSRGQRINIAMQDRKVRQVNIVGQVDGVYLEPLPPDSLAADSLRADSLAVPGDTTRPRPRPAPSRRPGGPAR